VDFVAVADAAREASPGGRFEMSGLIVEGRKIETGTIGVESNFQLSDPGGGGNIDEFGV
jgi:hypothetical protein